MAALLALMLGAGVSAPALADERQHDDGVASKNSAIDVQSPLLAQAASDPVTAAAFTVEHIWVPSTGWAEGERPHYTATMRFPPIAEGVHAIVSGQAGRLAEVTHCQLTPFLPQQGIVTTTCELVGRLEPGTASVTLAVRSEAGDRHSATVPVTLCPEQGCSSLFTVAVEPAIVSICLGDDLDSITAQYVLNVPWVPVASSLETAPGGISLGDTAIRNGSEVPLSGRLLTGGRHHLSLAIVDEFDGAHEVSLDIDVMTPQPGRCGVPASSPVAAPELAETGGPLPLGIGATGLILVALGAVALLRLARSA